MEEHLLVCGEVTRGCRLVTDRSQMHSNVESKRVESLLQVSIRKHSLMFEAILHPSLQSPHQRALLHLPACSPTDA